MSEELRRSLEWQIAEMKRELESQDEEIKRQAVEIRQIEERNDQRDRERAALERRQLIAGITFLGGIILTLIKVIWEYRSAIFKGSA